MITREEHFEYLIKTTTNNIDTGTYSSYYAFYLHGYNFALQEEINKDNDLQLEEDIKEYNNIVKCGIN